MDGDVVMLVVLLLFTVCVMAWEHDDDFGYPVRFTDEEADEDEEEEEDEEDDEDDTELLGKINYGMKYEDGEYIELKFYGASWEGRERKDITVGLFMPPNDEEKEDSIQVESEVEGGYERYKNFPVISTDVSDPPKCCYSGDKSCLEDEEGEKTVNGSCQKMRDVEALIVKAVASNNASLIKSIRIDDYSPFYFDCVTHEGATYPNRFIVNAINTGSIDVAVALLENGFRGIEHSDFDIFDYPQIFNYVLDNMHQDRYLLSELFKHSAERFKLHEFMSGIALIKNFDDMAIALRAAVWSNFCPGIHALRKCCPLKSCEHSFQFVAMGFDWEVFLTTCLKASSYYSTTECPLTAQECKKFTHMKNTIERAVENGNVFLLEDDFKAEDYDRYNGKCGEHTADYLDYITDAATRGHYDVAIMLSERGFRGIDFVDLNVLDHQPLLYYAKFQTKGNAHKVKAIMFGAAARQNGEEFKHAIKAITERYQVRDAVYAITQNNFCEGARILLENCPIPNCSSAMHIVNNNKITLELSNCVLKAYD
jgi:hypothetical protein